MPSLVDIAPIREKVTIAGVDLEIRGIGIDAIAQVLADFPDLQKFFKDATAGGAGAIDAMEILRRSPASAHALMAAAMGKLGDKEEIQAAAELPFGDQLSIVEATVRLSFPGGISPFVERLTAMLGSRKPLPNGALDAPSGKAPDTSLPQQSTS